ncbi:unnamed protein product [Anisakis simplex]|uniref:Innexin n=1 Tax=Anisakis simplex TaxID=6269 RepID=A0A0M3JR87_ANISI|nr:unnamed protein product [Anisakis simplex]
MDRLGKLIESITKPRYEEDFVDRLNYRVTTYILLAAAFTIIAKEYGGKPIQCWLPAELASQKGWEQYAENYCFVENTYYIPLDQKIPQSSRHRSERELTYYQWVPFMLMMQALMFTGPHVFWRMLNWMSGIQTRAVITMASSASKKNPATNEVSKMVDVVAAHLERSLHENNFHHHLAHSNPLVFLFRFQCLRVVSVSYLSSVYVLTKLLFIANAFLQHVILSAYLGSSGYEITKALLQQRSWEVTGLFPRVTMCDFKVRDIGHRHHFTIQCVLMANMFNEKIFLGLWWWILILLTTTCVNFIYWIYVMNCGSSKCNFLEGLITLGVTFHIFQMHKLLLPMEIESWDSHLVQFICRATPALHPSVKVMHHRVEMLAHQLGGDGMLVLRLMAQNAGEIITSLVAARLYDLFSVKQKENCNSFYNPAMQIPPLNDAPKKPLDEIKTPLP